MRKKTKQLNIRLTESEFTRLTKNARKADLTMTCYLGMMMLSNNLFLLFKFDCLSISEYRQQIKTFRLKYVFPAAKIIKTARYVIMKLSENYPYMAAYEQCLI